MIDCSGATCCPSGIRILPCEVFGLFLHGLGGPLIVPGLRVGEVLGLFFMGWVGDSLFRGYVLALRNPDSSARGFRFILQGLGGPLGVQGPGVGPQESGFLRARFSMNTSGAGWSNGCSRSRCWPSGIRIPPRAVFDENSRGWVVHWV